MWCLADQLIDEFVADERCEFASANGQPFPLLVIADLLGVPETDHSMFRELLAGKGPAEDGRVNMNPLAYLDKWFTAYISDRRDTPTRDMLTEMATQRFADGSLPEMVDVVRIATFLFIAGHETTARLLSSALRGNRDRIPNFVEEMLRLESPIKSDFRLTRVATTLGGVERPAKCAPERGVRPRGAQLPRGPLARIEGRVTIERILDRLKDIRIDEAQHGPAGDRRFDYVLRYILRGLEALHIEFTATP